MTATILIIGGGFSGVALSHALSRLAWPDGVRIVIADRSGRFGRGAAYSTDHTSHLLNVPAGRMGALADDEGHFLSWLRRADPSIAGDAFVPRSRYGDYLAHLLETARSGSNSNIQVKPLVDTVTALEPLAPDRVRARFASGNLIEVDRVVLATGNPPPRDVVGATSSDERCVVDPWQAGALKRIRGIESALMVGTGLTMVDAVLALRETNPRARFIAVSRRGLLPQAHRDHHPAKPGVIDISAKLAAWNGSAGDLFHIVRVAAERAESDGHDWRDVINGLRSLTPALWRRMPPREQARFFRHVRPFWDVHRHRMATRVAEDIDALVANGQLSIVAGRIAACTRNRAGFSVDVHTRDGRPQRYLADAVINCTGPDGDLSRSSDPLIASLREQGALVADALGIGIKTEDDGALIDANGVTSGVLFTLGATRRPALWESTAVPELREQAAALARRLHASFGLAG
jgi:uncharacterized NAD(P)/FAD-binding protein YdhS